MLAPLNIFKVMLLMGLGRNALGTEQKVGTREAEVLYWLRVLDAELVLWGVGWVSWWRL